MTVLHATEPATVYLSLLGAGRRGDRRRRRPGAVRRPHPGQAARDAAHPVRLPARPAAGGVGERVGAGRRHAAHPAGQGGREGRAWPTTAPRGWTSAGRRCWTCSGDHGAMTAQQLRARVPELEARLDLAPGKTYGANVPIAPRVLTQLGVEGEIVRGRNAGHWRLSRPRWTLMSRLARRRTARGEGGRGVRRAGRPLAAHLRPRHRGRPGVVAGRDQGRRPGRAGRRRGRRGVARRRRHRLGAARRRRPGRRRSSRGRRCCRCSTRR